MVQGIAASVAAVNMATAEVLRKDVQPPHNAELRSPANLPEIPLQAPQRSAARARRNSPVEVVISGTGNVGNMMAAAVANGKNVVMVGSARSVERAQLAGYLIVEVGKHEFGSKDNRRKVIHVNQPGENSPDKITVVSSLEKLDLAHDVIVIHAGLHQQIAGFLKKDAKLLNDASATHIVLQNTLDAADEVAMHVKEGTTIIQMVMKATASRKRDGDTEVTYCKAGESSSLEAINVPDHLKEQFMHMLDRRNNEFISTELKFGALDMKYSKVATNAATNPLIVLFRTENCRGLITRYESDPRFAKLMQAITIEVYEVGVAKEAFPQSQSQAEKNSAARNLTYQPLAQSWENLNHPTSTNISFASGDQTEISGINGGIAKFGKELGIPTPLNAEIANCFEYIESERSKFKTIGDFYADPAIKAYLDAEQAKLLALAEEAAAMHKTNQTVFNHYVTDMRSLAEMTMLNEMNDLNAGNQGNKKLARLT